MVSFKGFVAGLSTSASEFSVLNIAAQIFTQRSITKFGASDLPHLFPPRVVTQNPPTLEHFKFNQLSGALQRAGHQLEAGVSLIPTNEGIYRCL